MKNKGFTMIELLIVVAILGIILTIAIPSFQGSIRKARRSDGVGALIRLQIEQEKFRANCRFYAGTIHSSNATVCGADAAASNLLFSTTSEEAYYVIAVTAANGNSYTVTATAQGAQAVDTAQGVSCTTLTYVHPAGTKSPAACWD